MSNDLLAAVLKATKALTSEADQFCRAVEDASQTGVSLKRAPGWAMGGYLAVWPDHPTQSFLVSGSSDPKAVAANLDELKRASGA